MISFTNNVVKLINYSFIDGLYKLNIFYTNNILYPVYFESLNSTQTGETTLASYFNATIYAVPIMNNEFSVNLTSTIDMSVEYEIFNLNGDLLQSEYFELMDGEEIIYHSRIDPNFPLPNNMVVNKFTFEDGSTHTIQTIRSINN